MSQPPPSSQQRQQQSHDTGVGGKIRIQKLIFIRHGVARHNIRDPATGQGPNLHDPALWDPPLVYDGKVQALQAGERLRLSITHNQYHFGVDEDDDGSKITANACPPKPQLVISSPLTRCLQTSMLICGPGDLYTDNNNIDVNSNRLQTEEPTYICSELCREAFGMHYPDKRRQKSILQKYWPIFQFQHDMTEHDDAWRPDRRETINDVRRRASDLLDLIASRNETIIVTVSHGVFIETLLNTYCPEALQHGQLRVYNCDMYCVDCLSLSSVDHDNKEIGTGSSAGVGRRFVELRNPIKI